MPRFPRTSILGVSYTCAQSSAHRFLHERADPCLFGGGQLLQREGGRPHGAFVEVRLVVEAERRVPRVELLRALEEADDLAVLGIRGHPIPGFRREGWRAGFDDLMEPLGHGAIRFRHLGDRREHVAFPSALSLFARASAFSSWARAFIAARSSSVNPLDFLLIAVVLLADFCVSFFGLIETSLDITHSGRTLD